jgi:hypothetical protein
MRFPGVSEIVVPSCEGFGAVSIRAIKRSHSVSRLIDITDVSRKFLYASEPSGVEFAVKVGALVRPGMSFEVFSGKMLSRLSMTGKTLLLT